MSSVFGILNKKDKCELSHELEVMRRWNRFYGKDGEETKAFDNFIMGSCYLHVVCDSRLTHSVLHYGSQYAVIDAILYNRAELTEKYNAVAAEKMAADIPDEELLLRYVSVFGIKALAGVNGDFAGCIYDESTEEWTLFRDHMGVRPLFYYQEDSTLAFSTDMRGLLALDFVAGRPREEWIYKTICGYSDLSLENTEYEDIYCVKPGSYMTVTRKEHELHMEKTVYWEAGGKKIRMTGEEAYIGKMRELIMDAVKRRLERTGGTVGAELSGGLDSGVIDILINRMGRRGAYYSWSSSPEDVAYADKDERLTIKAICDQEGIKCNFSPVNHNLNENFIMSRIMTREGFDIDQDEPQLLRFALPPSVPELKFSETCDCALRNDARVVFSGHGGDEGASHRSNPYEMYYHHEYYHYLRYMWSQTHGKNRRITQTIKLCRNNLKHARQGFDAPFKNPFGAPDLLNKDFADKGKKYLLEKLYFAYNPAAYIRQGGSRPRLETIALNSGICGILYMFPYMDYRVVDYAVSIPRHMFLKNKENRYIFREAFKDIMPKILYRQTIKEDTSHRNEKKATVEPEEYTEEKKYLLNALNKDYWKAYLDFTVLEKWQTNGQPSGDEMRQDDNIYFCVYYMLMAQKTVEKAKKWV